ncbi:rifin [Plasmodium reichenowi]|uniref:Rifin n=1 Tax=Plasmodium reichenowi TaxID=5854 RepID=A0A060RM40_PLARE|nr:rifin [Plasmodium reichenowi]
MKVHYINILLFALPLNILVYNQRNHKNTTHHTPKIPTTRLLCECDLYMSNYDNDLEMKVVMENFNKQTQQRFEEYDDRMKTTRQKYKDKCDKEIQKIILKDKLEKELMDKFATLQTDIQSDAIPTCVCEKSVADKVEKGCLRCAGILSAAMPEVSSIGGSLLSALYAWKPKALEAAINFATKEGIKEGIKAGAAEGVYKVLHELYELGAHNLKSGILDTILSKTQYTNAEEIANIIHTQYQETCTSSLREIPTAGCNRFQLKLDIIRTSGGSQYVLPAKDPIEAKVTEIVGQAKQVAAEVTETTTNNVTAQLTTENRGVINTIYMSNQTAIIASIVAIVVIVLIMVIIYLILRYRRKKKMKKKLQYIKLLEE